MKTKVISVRLQSLVSISDKAYKATCFDGSSAIIPKSQIFGQDFEVKKSDAYWITEWILKQKDLQYSNKKTAFYDSVKSRIVISPTYIKHVPKPISKYEAGPDTTELFR